MTVLLIVIATAALMISINAMYVAAEFSAVVARKTRISQMAAKDNRLAKMLLPIMEDSRALDNYIAACQLGITASSLVLGAYGQNVAADYLAPLLVRLDVFAQAAADSIAAIAMLLLFTVLQVVLGELFPKSIAIQYPEQLALATVTPMRWSQVLLKPFIWLFNGSGNLVLRLLGHEHKGGHSNVHSPEEIELLVKESHMGGLLDDVERQMLRNALRMRDLTAKQVMVPRIRLLAADNEQTVDQIIAKSSEVGVSRIPLYEGNIDNIIGFVHIKDLFRLQMQGEQQPRAVMRKAVYVPETLPIANVWETLSQQRQYIAIVFDEYGGTAGLITIEDMIEEIFGELQDEFDEDITLAFYDEEGRFHLRGDLLVIDVNEYLDLKLPDDQADTLGGLVFTTLGRVPKAGDEVTIDGLTIRVEVVDSLRIIDLSLQLAGKKITTIHEWESIDKHE